MSILKRFSDIMASNVNALLDKMEDPSKMVDQVLRNLQDDFNKVKAETAGIMADEARAKRELHECTLEINKMQDYAQRAVKMGNDEDARRFLQKKIELISKEGELKKVYDAAAANAQKMKQMHDKLLDQIEDLNNRRDSIKAKMDAAKVQKRINEVGSSINKSKGSLNTFERLEEKANRALDEAEAVAKLNSLEENDIEELMDKYDSPRNTLEDELNALKAGLDSSVEDELAKLKEEIDK